MTGTGYAVKKIIEKTEKSTVDWKKGATGNRSFPLKEYNGTDYKQISRSDFASEIHSLEQSGLLKCDWYQRYSEVKAAVYRLDDLPEFYRLAGIREKYRRLDALIGYIEYQEGLFRQEWLRKALGDMRTDLRVGKIPPELKAAEEYLRDRNSPADQWPQEAEQCGKLELFSVLRALDRLEEPVYKRIFSSSCLRDTLIGGKTVKASKVFEKKYQDAVISLAVTYHENVDDSMDATQILSQLNIEEYAQELAVKGPLRIVLDGREIDLSCFTYGTVLNSQTLKYGHPATRQRIRRIVTVENKANYERMAYREDMLIIFCHGYFTPREREFLILLRETLQGDGAAYYHTGDLDYGGICIFRYNRERIFPELQPLFMDEEQYRRSFDRAEQLEKESLEKLKKIREPLLQPLIDCILETGMGIEQENFQDNLPNL